MSERASEQSLPPPEPRRSWVPGVNWLRTRRHQRMIREHEAQTVRVSAAEKAAKIAQEQEAKIQREAELLEKADSVLGELPFKRYPMGKEQMVADRFSASNIGEMEVPGSRVKVVFESNGHKVECRRFDGRYVDETLDNEYTDADFERLHLVNRAALTALSFVQRFENSISRFTWFNDRIGEDSGPAPYQPTELTGIVDGEPITVLTGFTEGSLSTKYGDRALTPLSKPEDRKFQDAFEHFVIRRENSAYIITLKATNVHGHTNRSTPFPKDYRLASLDKVTLPPKGDFDMVTYQSKQYEQAELAEKDLDYLEKITEIRIDWEPRKWADNYRYGARGYGFGFGKGRPFEELEESPNKKIIEDNLRRAGKLNKS